MIIHKTIIKQLAKFESAGLVKFTRYVGRAKMYRLDANSPTANTLQQHAFSLAEKDIEKVDPLQQRLTKITQMPAETTTMTAAVENKNILKQEH